METVSCTLVTLIHVLNFSYSISSNFNIVRCLGDVAYFDNDGLFYIVDRIKELIKVKGLQVAPAELEAVLLEHPKVADSGVVGVKDARAGELPRAFIVKKDASLTQEEVQAFMNGKC